MNIIQLRNVPDSLYEAIKASAIVSRRSMTKEVISLVEKALNADTNQNLVNEKKVMALSELKKIAKKNSYKPSTNEIIEMISEDRNR